MLNGITTGQATTYGTALAARYATAPNIVWLYGNDYDDTAGFNGILDNVLAALVAGGANQMVVIEHTTEGDSRFLFSANTVQNWGTANSEFNWVYSYCGSYPGVQYGYGESSPLPVMYCDGAYDLDQAIAQSGRDYFRNMCWWALTSGSRGYIYGRQNIYAFDTALTHLADNQFDNADLGAITGIFRGFTGWHQLVPDTASAFVTAGRGTALGFAPSGTGIQYTGLSGGFGGAVINTYRTASITPDGTLAMVYLPDATASVTVNTAMLALGWVAKWVDPLTGTRTAAGTGPAYSHPGTNSAGAADWVLAFVSPGYAAWAVP
jgi:hypothetical protein